MTTDETTIAFLLVDMRFCRLKGIKFDACLAEARKRFNREVREEALTKPLPTK